MKKTGVVGGVVLGLALCGYGAWCAYKKFSPECESEMKKDMKKIRIDVEKIIENIM